MIAAGIHPHFQGTGFEALPLHFSKSFPWSSESVWLGLGSVKSGLPPPPPLPSPSLPPPLHFSLSFIWSYLFRAKPSPSTAWMGVLSPIKATEPFPGPASGVCQNFSSSPLGLGKGNATCEGPTRAGVPSWGLVVKVMFC